ncbi:hypothetical protein [Streptomyces sp. NBC_00059]|uniref:hypothetical protein n=1 Tax=Streptomyces sp. NBC_00059 TaxID=2975635 RepID=UPI002258D1BE|nr:hypothetical protein [Streptomyces sp. NBC_00059]MCX5412861.1 hypothetical protein [Streptomyces sp. NBC_00059]
MDFTSGRTGGPRLDAAALAQVDRGSNVWGSLTAMADAQRAAEMFHSAGWGVRRSSWTEFEVECAFAELELLPVDPVVFSGFVDPDRIAVLLAALKDMGMPFTVEFEDNDGREHVHHSETRPSR